MLTLATNGKGELRIGAAEMLRRMRDGAEHRPNDRVDMTIRVISRLWDLHKLHALLGWGKATGAQVHVVSVTEIITRTYTVQTTGTRSQAWRWLRILFTELGVQP